MVAAVDLWWLPLGAGGHVVRWGGRAYEAAAALAAGRRRADLFHAALTVSLPEASYAVEVAPEWSGPAGDRGRVGGGPVGLRPLGRSRWFRYEVRRWRDGVIPDLAYAVASPVRVAGDEASARLVLAQVAVVPLPVWGRDELGLGEMWNSNSVVAWVLATAGVDVADLRPPHGGRAPGWDAGRALASRR